MKIQLLVFPLLTCLPVGVWAQTPAPKKASKTLPPIAVEPAAQALINRAIESYKGATGVSYSNAQTISGKKGPIDRGTTFVRYSLPDKLSVFSEKRRSSVRLLADGKNFYWVIGDKYYKQDTDPEKVATILASRYAPGQIIAALMKGENPAVVTQRDYSAEARDFKMSRVTALAPRVIDGDVLSGIQYTYSYSFPIDGEMYASSDQVTMWFGGSPLLLRRAQTRSTHKGKVFTTSDTVFDQQLSPNFAEDTFKFNDAGLKLTTDEEEANATYWDPRLKVGTTPFPFQAKALDGTAISLDKYRGKVLLLDFWATWCGPCVASLPELQGAYNKYHAKGLEVVSISLDEDKKALTSFVKAKKMAWLQVFDGKAWKSAIPTSYGVQAIPFLLLIGKNGKIAAVNPRGKIDEAVKAALAAR